MKDLRDPFTIDAFDSQSIHKDILEKDVQKKSVDWARLRGYWARKFSSPAQRSVPDYLFAHQEYRDKFAVEFKAPGKTSTDAQKDEQRKMREAGWDVYECDGFEKFKELVAKRERDVRP
jgi:hypothetical protein